MQAQGAPRAAVEMAAGVRASRIIGMAAVDVLQRGPVQPGEAIASVREAIPEHDHALVRIAPVV